MSHNFHVGDFVQHTDTAERFTIEKVHSDGLMYGVKHPGDTALVWIPEDRLTLSIERYPTTEYGFKK